MQINRHSIKDWVVATRPWSFPASAMPVIVTIAWSFVKAGTVNLWLGLYALFTIVMVHASGNLWSDYFDYKKGVDTEATFGSKTLTSGMFKPEEIKAYSIVILCFALLLGLGLVLLTGMPVLWIGLAGLVLSLLYPLMKFHALGDLLIAICYAFLPTVGTTYVVTGEIDWGVLWVALPICLITMAILHVNNVRDIETDSDAGIITFPMLTGRRFGAALYCFEVLFPYFWIVIICAMGIVPWWCIITFVSLPISIKNTKMMMGYKKGIEAYKYLDEKTAQLQLIFSILLSIGLLIGKMA